MMEYLLKEDYWM